MVSVLRKVPQVAGYFKKSERLRDIFFISSQGNSPVCRISRKLVQISAESGELPQIPKIPQLVAKKHSHFPSFLRLQTLKSVQAQSLMTSNFATL